MDINELKSGMMAMGLMVDDIILDGKIQRVPVIGRTKKNGWYVGVILAGRPFCSYGRWDTGETVKWSHNGYQISDSDRTELLKIQERVADEKRRLQARAVKIANQLWADGIVSIELNHEYLRKKHIRPIGCKIHDDQILIPIFHPENGIVNLQRIYPDGSKKFLYGGEISGCLGVIHGNIDRICICEGYATAASIHEATGYHVIIAFNAGNLKAVSEAVKARYPSASILIAGDNDESKTGEKYGRAAAESISANFLMPSDAGMDWNDFHQQHGADVLKEKIESGFERPADPQPEIRILTRDDLQAMEMGLNIPDRLWQGKGLIETGIRAATMSGAPDILQYQLPVVLSMIARAISNKIKVGGIYPTLYNIKVGGTSTGKTDCDTAFKQGLQRYAYGLKSFYGPSDFASGPGLLRAMTEGRNQMLIALDEISYLFRRGERSNQVIDQKIAVLLELYTASGSEYTRAFSEKSNAITIENPCLILTGNATMGIFDEIKQADLESGLMQRFDFWTYTGRIPYRIDTPAENPDMEAFIGALIKIMNAQNPNKDSHDLSALIGCVDIGLTADAKIKLDEFSHSIIDRANAIEDTGGQVGIISRQYNLALKYGLIHVAATRPIESIYDPMDESDLQWGIDVASMLCEWKLNVLCDRVRQGQFHSDCELFKDAIRIAMKNNMQPSLKVLVNRKKALKRIKPRDLDDIIGALTKRGEIISEYSPMGKTLVYRLVSE